MMLNYLQTASYLLNFIFRPRFKLFIDIDIVLDLKEVEREAENQKHLVEKTRFKRNEKIKVIVLKERLRLEDTRRKGWKLFYQKKNVDKKYAP